MKITQRDKNLMLVMLGVVLVFCSYYFGFRTLKSWRQGVEQENMALEGQIRVLREISADQEQYVQDAKELKGEMDKILAQFPADMTSEDIILYMRDLEKKNAAYISSITLPGQTNVAVAAEKEVDVLNQYGDITGAVAANSFVNDGSVPDTANMYLSKIESDVAFSVSYGGLKNMISDITMGQERKSIDEISLVFNENTGDLSGSMTINYFVLSGTGKEYIQPTITGNRHGIESIFGNLKTRTEVTGEDEKLEEIEME
ncbi:MAG: hypothetical protein MSS92_09760 [Lachnospiraceae bacterium]|nr:hypothetical protein [Lachnospiraceae bacterium]